MTGSVPPAPTGSPQDNSPESESANPIETASPGMSLPFIRTRAGRLTAALVLIALAASYVAGTRLFRADGYRKGYAAGRASVGYYEGAAIADSMKAIAGDTVLARAGLMPDSGQPGLWHVARFSLTPARSLCRYGSERALDTVRLPVFSRHEQAPVGRSYRSVSNRLYHVDR